MDPVINHGRESVDDGIVPADSVGFISPQVLKRKLGDTSIEFKDADNTAGLNPTADKRSKLNQKFESSMVRKLACPIFKKDAHNAAISGTCRGPGWDSISRVKEHLYRRHTLKNQCVRCRKGFDSASDLATHLRNPERCPVLDILPETITITGDQVTELRYRGGKRKNYSNEEKWKSLYRILFPSDSFIPSPYYDEPCYNCTSKASARVLDEFRQYQLREFKPLVEQELAAMNHSNNISDDLCAHIADILSRLSVKVLDEFQEKSIADSAGDKPVACLSQHGNGCEIEGLSSDQTAPGFHLSQEPLSHDSMVDMTEDSLEDFDFTVG
ncbi:hypothetical protein F5Y01DRAFT_317304 [Xylaria sp. FL0043]|nr:hypothetical protein F5Y01DRAFT_317304 [Xylaria sp. FL0043]